MRHLELTRAACTLAFAALVAGLCAAGEAGGRLRTVTDPAEALVPETLSNAEKARFATLAVALADDDFVVREKAQADLLAFGPRVEPLVKSLEKSPDAEVRQFAIGFPSFLALKFRGYLPTSPRLLATLEAKRRFFIGKRESFHDVVGRALRDSELDAAFDWEHFPERITGGEETVEFTVSAREALERFLAPVGRLAIPRGARIAIMTPVRAKELEVQTHVFDCASLSAQQRETLAASMAAWMPAGCDVRAEAAGLRVSGRESHLRIAARALYCLVPESLNLPPLAASDAVFPKPPSQSAVESAFKTLAAPVPDFNAQGVEPQRMFALLRANGYPVAVDLESGWVPAQNAVGLKLTGLPLGLDLRWLAARANKSKKDEVAIRLDFTIHMGTRDDSNGGPQILAKFRTAAESTECPESVGFANVSFVFEDAARRDPATAEKAALDALQTALDDEIALYPGDERDCAWQVFERRLLVRGPAFLVSRIVRLVSHWRETGVPPRAAWRIELERQLHQEIVWDGRQATPRTLLPKLHELTGLNILLEHEDETVPAFEMEASQAELLPPGKYRANELLQRLSEVIKAKWRIKYGAVVFISK